MKYQIARKLARENRKNQTRAEKKFWENVRNRRFYNVKFTRQFLIKYRLYESIEHYFISDFYCHQERLIIEIDGPIHENQKEYDLERESVIKAQNLKVLRFANDDVINKWDEVAERLKDELGI